MVLQLGSLQVNLSYYREVKVTKLLCRVASHYTRDYINIIAAIQGPELLDISLLQLVYALKIIIPKSLFLEDLCEQVQP